MKGHSLPCQPAGWCNEEGVVQSLIVCMFVWVFVCVSISLSSCVRCAVCFLQQGTVRIT